jgi:lipopolysaccharide transport system ATP-binding protein
MQVRLAFSVAAHLEPEILVVDEVLAVGDAEFQKKCLGKMDEVSTRQGRTVLFVSHQLGVVARLCSRAMLLSDGVVAYSGSSAETINKYVAEGVNSAKSTKSNCRIGHRAMAIRRVLLVDRQGVTTDQFSWHDPIRVHIELDTRRPWGSTLLGVGVDSSQGVRVTTWVTRLADHVADDTSYSTMSLEITPMIIAPGGYTLTVALFEPGVMLHHQLEGEAPFMIVDSGSEMAAFSNVNYGVTIIPARWSVA